MKYMWLKSQNRDRLDKLNCPKTTTSVSITTLALIKNVVIRDVRLCLKKSNLPRWKEKQDKLVKWWHEQIN